MFTSNSINSCKIYPEMSRKSNVILEVCTILAQQENLKVTIEQSAEGAAIVGAGSFIGALIGGRKGLLAGAALGSAAAMAICSDFKSVVDIIRDEMTESQKKQLAREVGYLLEGINISTAASVVAIICANSGLKNQVVNEISSFVKNQMQNSLLSLF